LGRGGLVEEREALELWFFEDMRERTKRYGWFEGLKRSRVWNFQRGLELPKKVRNFRRGSRTSERKFGTSEESREIRLFLRLR